MKTRKRRFMVEMEVPIGAQVGDCRDYIEEAISAWAGSLRPPYSYGDEDYGDPMFNLNRETIKVTRLNR